MKARAAVLHAVGAPPPYAQSRPLRIEEIEIASPQAMELAYRVTRRGGTTVTAGLPHPDHRWPLQQVNLTAEERTVKGSYVGSCVPVRDIPRYIALYRQGRLPVDRLMSDRLALEEINAGFDRLASGRVVRQIVML